ncbi:MAG: hypothetical protein ACJ79L_18365 [Anaeromyxobacteraceae bacterium]
MNRTIRSIVLGGTAALALAAGPASAHDLDHHGCEPAPLTARAAPTRLAGWERGGDRDLRRREYDELAAARERFYRGWHGNRRDRDRFERWCATRRAELDGRWGFDHDRR